MHDRLNPNYNPMVAHALGRALFQKTSTVAMPVDLKPGIVAVKERVRIGPGTNQTMTQESLPTDVVKQVTGNTQLMGLAGVVVLLYLLSR